MDELEIEVKFFVARPDDLRQRIMALGARSDGRVFERNWIFDDPQRLLATRGELLRLRHDAAWHLTYKQPSGCDESQFKIRREIETTIGDGEALRAVFTALGLTSVLTYEKWRETFHLGQVHLCLDQLPYGHFLEIEGPGAHIHRLALNLGLDWGRRILGTYLDLFRIIGAEMGLAFGDITFANFEQLTVDPENWRHRFEAG